jgi:hypothetical protein
MAYLQGHFATTRLVTVASVFFVTILRESRMIKFDTLPLCAKVREGGAKSEELGATAPEPCAR